MADPLASLTEAKNGGDGSEFSIGEIEAGAEGIAEGFGGGVEEVGEELAVPQLREKMPRRTLGMVKTNWRWGTSWQTAAGWSGSRDLRGLDS